MYPERPDNPMNIFQRTTGLLRRVATHPRSMQLRWKLRYLRWRLTGSGPYSNSYVEQVTSEIEAGEKHTTLSVELNDPALALREATFVADTLMELGLAPSDICIEYGCGALRIGEQLMKRLEPGNYVGLDVTDRFWKNGMARLGDDVIGRYQPRLELIGEDNNRLAELNTRFVVCIAVFIHVPPPELNGFMAKLVGVMGERTELVLDAPLRDRTQQIHYRTWLHARARVRQLFARHGLEVVRPSMTSPDLPEELWVLRKTRA